MKPIGEVLNGIEIKPLDDGDVAIEVVILAKTLDVDGNSCWVSRSTTGMHDVEMLGALHAEVLIIGKRVMDTFIPDQDDD